MSLFEREQYSVECPDGSDVAVLRGVMRLPSPAAYETLLAPVRSLIESGRPSTMDLSAVAFMNSSGIRALAALVLLAKDRATPLTIVANDGAPWQKKTLASLCAISPELRVTKRAAGSG